MIIHNAIIHSPVERFATALHVEGEIITWMGDEDTAEFRIRAHPDVRVIDANQELLTPTFHDASSDASARDLHRLGVTAAQAHVQSEDELAVLREHSLDVVGIFRENLPRTPCIHLLSAGASAAEMEQFLQEGRPAQRSPAVAVDSREDAAAFSDLLAGQQIPPARVYLDAAHEIEADALTGWEVIICANRDINLRIADLARTGVPFALRGRGTPWETITRVLFEGPAPVSARAAFNAYTRGAWRLTPGPYEPRGLLHVGARADLASWEVDALAVQAPDGATAHWSTDQRAGTPLLPALGEEEQPPKLTRLFHRGSEIERGC